MPEPLELGGQAFSIDMPNFSDFSWLVVHSELLVSCCKVEKEGQGLRDKAEG